MNPPLPVAAITHLRQGYGGQAGHRRILPCIGRLTRCLFLTATLSLPAQAQIDTQELGMSDFWQRHFNRDNPGQLFDPQNPAHQPEADPDGDGWTNLQESIAGTDPFDPNPPDGRIVSHITYLKDQEEAPSPEYPEGRIIDIAVISWDTVPGKQYVLSFSPNLTAGSWLAADSPYYGDGLPAAISITLNDAEGFKPDKLFWRVQVEDIDSDGDGLTDYEEFLLGLNPYSSQTHTGIPDHWVATHFPFSANAFVPNIVPFANGLTYQQMYALGINPNQNVVIGPVNLAAQEEIMDFPDLSFRDENPADLYHEDSVEGWEAVIGEYIEIWDEGDGNIYMELQAHLQSHGVRQQFNMLPGSQISFVLRYKGRYDWCAPYDNAFSLEVEGACQVSVGGSNLVPLGGVTSHTFMNEDDWEKYEDWHYTSVVIFADPEATALVPISLTLAPENTEPVRSQEITRGGFVGLELFDIIADTNRDGDINPVTDAHGKDEWNNRRGAIYSVNFDRDGTNEMGGVPMPDAINFGDNGQGNFEHYEIANAADEDDIAPFKIRALKGLPEDYKVFLRVDEEESMRAVHIFKKIEAGEEAIWGSYMDPATSAPWASGPDVSDPSALERDISRWINENHPNYEETRDDPTNEEYYTFGLEGLVLRGMDVPGGTLDQITGDPNDAGKFSGEILLHLEIRDPQNNVFGTDSIRLRVAPWLALSHQEVAEELYIGVDAAIENDETRNAPLIGRYTGLHHTGIMEEIPTPQRWLQDHIEIGYTQRPGGPKTHLVFRLPYNNRHAAAAWPYHELLAPDVGLFQLGRDIWDGATDGTHPGGDHGGNLETLPPTQDQPHGVILMGDTASAPMRAFIRAQEFQSVGGSFASPAQWLEVGHIDEYSSFLSDRRVLIASSRLGIETLENEIPVTERHLRVLFATDPEVIAGTVTADTPAINSPIITTGRDHLIEGDGVEEAGIGRVAYLRFYSGNARGHVVKAQLHDGHAEVLEWWYTGITIDQYQSAKGAPPGTQWTVAPSIGDKYVLIKESKRWSGGMPAMITVEEVLASENINFQNLNRYHIQTNLNQVESAIRGAGGGSSETHFIPVPVLLFADLVPNTTEIAYRSAYAFSPGPTNLQPVSGNLYVHRQFGPINALGEDIYEKAIKNSVQESVYFVDGWDAYHVLIGEIHCGTNVTRTIPDELWWENLPQQQP